MMSVQVRSISQHKTPLVINVERLRSHSIASQNPRDLGVEFRFRPPFLGLTAHATDRSTNQAVVHRSWSATTHDIISICSHHSQSLRHPVGTKRGPKAKTRTDTMRVCMHKLSNRPTLALDEGSSSRALPLSVPATSPASIHVKRAPRLIREGREREREL